MSEPFERMSQYFEQMLMYFERICKPFERFVEHFKRIFLGIRTDDERKKELFTRSNGWLLVFVLPFTVTIVIPLIWIQTPYTF